MMMMSMGRLLDYMEFYVYLGCFMYMYERNVLSPMLNNFRKVS